MSQVKESPDKATDAYMPDHSVELLVSPKWVRVFFGGEYIADSRKVILVRHRQRTPIYYFPREDVRTEFLKESTYSRELEGLGQASYWTVEIGEHVAQHAAWSISEPEPEAGDLEGYIAFKWGQMDAWFEEDEQVYVHARDPYTRVDVAQSSRHVRVVVGGKTVAETDRPVLLFETGLPTRYYIPKVDVRMDMLKPSKQHTECPYKGVASYYSVEAGEEVYENIAWYYPFPYPEVGKIQNLIAFYNEKVDALYVDGEEQIKPVSPWSK
jgi:uncharacterized protein (DUF427 family)